MKNEDVLRARVALVLGLGSVATACGGKVIFDGSAGSGAGVGGFGATGVSHVSASAAQTTGVSVAATTTGGGCTVQGPPGDMLEQVCFNVGVNPCPSRQDPKTLASVQATLNQQTQGPCHKMADLVACGPSAATTNCCYQVYDHPLCVMGRPLDVCGDMRTAEIAPRADWLRSMKPTTEGMDGETRALLGAAWGRDALIEHASIASFARFTLELLAVGAPAELVRDAQLAMGDEIRHAELSFAIASLYSGRPLGPTTLRTDDARPRTSLAEIAAATVREGCVNETIAALVAAEARDFATDPAVRAALTEIAADEARHVELAWRMVRWALEIGGADVRDAVVAAFTGALSTVSAPSALVSAPDLSRRGQLNGAQKDRVARDVLATVIRPLSSALLAELREQTAEVAPGV